MLRCVLPIVYVEHKVTNMHRMFVITQLYYITKVSRSTTCFGYFDLAIVRLETHVEENYIYIQYNTKSQLSNCTIHGITKEYKTTISISLGGGTRSRLQQVGACV
jgi:hypothetical protein